MQPGGAPPASMYVYADSEDSLPSHLICAVCHDVAGTHSACPGCQQTFCEVCVHKWFDVQRTTGSNCTCPYCRRKLRFSDLTHNPAVQQQLDQLSVLCPNAPAGCATVCPRAELPAHLQHSCMLEEVSCRFCGKTGVRSAILQHEGSSCRQRLVPCSNAAAGCGASVPLDSMQQHLELNCSFTCKACQHCATPVPRRAWLDHLQRNCPAQQPCPLRMCGCCFSGDPAAVADHSRSCSYARQRQRMQQLQDLCAGGSIASGASTTAAAAAGPFDCWELPEDSVPDAAAAFGACTAAMTERQVRQLLLGTLPQAALPPRLEQQQQQPQQQLDALSDDAAASLKQLSTITPPKVFAAPSVAAAVAAAAAAGAGVSGTAPVQGPAQADTSSSSSTTKRSMQSAVELLALGAPGCLSGFGLQPDPLLECAWRVMLNSAVKEVFQVQEVAANQDLSTFMLYSSICRAWDTVLAWTNSISSSTPTDAQQQQQQQTDSDAEAPFEQQQTGAAASSSSGGADSGPAHTGMLAALSALLSGATSSSNAAAQGQNTPQQQQEQERTQLTGRQIWERMLADPSSSSRHAQQDGRRSADSGASGSSSADTAGSFDADRYAEDDGLPGLQRALYDEEYTDLEYLFSRTAPGRQLTTAAASAVYCLCLWLSLGGPCYCAEAADAERVGDLTQTASHRVGGLLVRLLQKKLKEQQKEDRKQQRRAARDSSGSGSRAAGAATAAGTSSQGAAGARGLAGSQLPSRGGEGTPSGDSSDAAAAAAAAAGGEQQQQHHAAAAMRHMHLIAVLMWELAAARSTSVCYEAEGGKIPALLQAVSSVVEAISSDLNPAAAAGQMHGPGSTFAQIRQQLLALAAASVPGGFSHRHVPPWLRGLPPLVALELGSALLLLHDVRADQSEVSLIPGVNSHVQHGYRAYWAPSVLAGVGAWLGPGFKLSWQALAVVNDMLVALVEELCQVLGDSFYDHAEERVPLSPGLALEAARLVLPAGLLSSGLPHLLRLSSAYRDVSCEDLSEVTWEQLARKLGLVAELDKLVCLVHELLPVTFEDEDEDDSEDEFDEDEDEDEGTSSSDSSDLSDSSSSSSSSSSGTGDDEESPSEYEEASADSYVTDEDEQTGTEDDGSSSSIRSVIDLRPSGSSDGSIGGGGSSSSEDGGSGGQQDEHSVYANWLRGFGRQRRPSFERAAAASRDEFAGIPPLEWPAAAAQEATTPAAVPLAAAAAAGDGSSDPAGSGSSSGSEWETDSEGDTPAPQQLQVPVRRGNTSSRPRAAAAAAGASSSSAAPATPAAAGRSHSSRRGHQAAASKLQGEQQQQQQTSPSPRQEDRQSGRSPQQEMSAAGTSSPAAAAAADAAEADTAAAAAAASSDNGSCGESDCLWQQQWADNLDVLAKSAAAAAQGGASSNASAAAADASGSIQHSSSSSSRMPGAAQQQEQAAGESAVGPASTLSPYAAQLLAQACETARRQPDQLLLQQGSLTSLGLSDPRSDGEATDSTAAAAAAAAQLSGAGSSTGPVTGLPSREALYFRSAMLPATELLLQLTAAAHSLGGGGTAAAAGAQAATGAPDVATAGATAGAGIGSAAAHGAAAAAAAITVGSNGARGWERMQSARQQQQQQSKVEEPGDACTHGVVLLVGLLEVVLKRLLQGAGRLAAADPDLLLSSSSTASNNSSSSSSSSRGGGGAAGNAAADAGEGAADGDGRVLSLQSVQPRVVVTAKHVQMAVAEDEDLTTLLLRSWPGAAVKNAVCWAGAPPCLDPQLLPDPTSEPLTAFLLGLAHGPPSGSPQEQQEQQDKDQHHQQRQQQADHEQQQQADAQRGTASSNSSSEGSSGNRPVLFPADLRFYCGLTVSAPAAATPRDAPSTSWFAPQSLQSTAGAGAGPTEAAAAAAVGQGEVAGTAESEGPSATCCFLSGWQCSTCAAQTAELAAAGLEARLAACAAGLQHVASQQQQQQQQQQEEEEGLPLLSKEQLQQLATATRLYHLQQPCWYDSNDSNSSISAGNGVRGCTADPTAGADRAQLQEMAALLQPLRDAVALREAHLQQQQQQPGCALPPELFEQTVQDVLSDVLAARKQQRQQEERVQEGLRRVLGPGRSSLSAAAGSVLRSPGRPAAASFTASSPARTPSRSSRTASGGEGPSIGVPQSPAAAGRSRAANSGAGAVAEDDCELSMQADAVQLLQQAAEDFLVQQLSGANQLALHAGRQEVRPQDLRLALQSSGYGHLLPGGPGAAADSRGTGRAAAPGRRGKGRWRVLGAGLFS